MGGLFGCALLYPLFFPGVKIAVRRSRFLNRAVNQEVHPGPTSVWHLARLFLTGENGVRSGGDGHRLPVINEFKGIRSNPDTQRVSRVPVLAAAPASEAAASRAAIPAGAV